MGGMGSGNHYHWHRPMKKGTVEASLDLDANRWAREGLFRPGERSGGWRWTYRGGHTCSIGYTVRVEGLDGHVVLTYTATPPGGEPERVEYRVWLEATRPRFGGVRWWFLCPLSGCDRRVAKLYLPPRGQYFGCRHCHRLTYTSCQESGQFRSLYRQLAAEMGTDPAAVRRVFGRLGKRR